jgi:hypothetical protein
MRSLSLFSVILMLSVTAPSFSQVRVYGLKLGAVNATQSWAYTAQIPVPTTNRWGVDIGAYIEWFDMSPVSLVTEMHFTERGVSEKLVETTPEFPEGTGNVFLVSDEVDYLSVPILLKGRCDIGPADLYLLAGPRIDLRLGSRGGVVFAHFRDVSYGPTFGAGVLLHGILSGRALGLEYRVSPVFGSEYSTPALEVTSASMEFLLTLEL